MGVVALQVVALFCLFSTSAPWSRWQYWQGPVRDDVHRFGWRAGVNDAAMAKPFESPTGRDAVTQSTSNAIHDYRFHHQTISESTGQHDSTALILTRGNSMLLTSGAVATRTATQSINNRMSPSAGTDIWPQTEWQILESPEDAGWSVEKLEEAKKFSESVGSDAVVIVQDGVVVQQWGDFDQPFDVYSIRKSLLGALIGKAIDDGELALDSTLLSLGIDDTNPSLSEAEKLATLKDLLTSRSGIYHPAAYEAAEHRAQRPRAALISPANSFIITIGISTR